MVTFCKTCSFTLHTLILQHLCHRTTGGIIGAEYCCFNSWWILLLLLSHPHHYEPDRWTHCHCLATGNCHNLAQSRSGPNHLYLSLSLSIGLLVFIPSISAFMWMLQSVQSHCLFLKKRTGSFGRLCLCVYVHTSTLACIIHQTHSSRLSLFLLLLSNNNKTDVILGAFSHPQQGYWWVHLRKQSHRNASVCVTVLVCTLTA